MQSYGSSDLDASLLLMPLTFFMPPVSAIILLSSMYWGALLGGSTTSILFNIPGEPSSVATTFDGHPMAKQGKAAEALSLAFLSSGFGALVGVVTITIVADDIAGFALRFSPPMCRIFTSCQKTMAPICFPLPSRPTTTP